MKGKKLLIEKRETEREGEREQRVGFEGESNERKNSVKQ